MEEKIARCEWHFKVKFLSDRPSVYLELGLQLDDGEYGDDDYFDSLVGMRFTNDGCMEFFYPSSEEHRIHFQREYRMQCGDTFHLLLDILSAQERMLLLEVKREGEVLHQHCICNIRPATDLRLLGQMGHELEIALTQFNIIQLGAGHDSLCEKEVDNFIAPYVEMETRSTRLTIRNLCCAYYNLGKDIFVPNCPLYSTGYMHGRSITSKLTFAERWRHGSIVKHVDDDDWRRTRSQTNVLSPKHPYSAFGMFEISGDNGHNISCYTWCFSVFPLPGWDPQLSGLFVGLLFDGVGACGVYLASHKVQMLWKKGSKIENKRVQDYQLREQDQVILSLTHSTEDNHQVAVHVQMRRGAHQILWESFVIGFPLPTVCRMVANLGKHLILDLFDFSFEYQQNQVDLLPTMIID